MSRFRFGAFEVDSRTGEVRRNGLKVKLQEKPFQVLLLLLEQAGKAVTREELRQRLWPADTFVDFDAGLNTALNKLRHALNDSADNPVLIETIPRHGYRFVAPIIRVESAADSPTLPAEPPSYPPAEVTPGSGAATKWISGGAWQRIAVASSLVLGAVLLAFLLARPRISLNAKPASGNIVILVLPFDNLSGDPSQEYFSDGLTEEMITQLGRQSPGQLAVIARSSAMQYRNTHKPLAQIARELKVDYVIEGSVRRADGRVRITAQLFQARDEHSLWAETYEQELADVLAIQREVAARITSSLALELLPATPARVARAQAAAPEAYDDYLKGLYQFNRRTREGQRRSLEYFQQATEKDPHFAPAFAALSYSYEVSAGWALLRPRDAYPRAKQAALQALELDDSSAEAHTALAVALHEYDWDWTGAEREYRRALELNANSAVTHKAYAEYLTHAGRFEEALAEIRRAQQLDPLSLITNAMVCYVFYWSRQNDQAVAECKKVLDLDPKFVPAHYFLGSAYARQKRPDAAISEYEKARAFSDDASIMETALATADAASGKKREAQRLLDALEQRSRREYVSSYGLAQVHLALGDPPRGLALLGRACDEHAPEVMFLAVAPGFDGLRSDPRFQQLINRIGFPNQVVSPAASVPAR